MLSTILSDFANQEFYVIANGHRFVFTLHTFRGITYADVVVDDETVLCRSVRCIMNEWIIPYHHLYKDIGNFRFEATSDDYPYHSDFPTKCPLCYYSAEELKEM